MGSTPRLQRTHCATRVRASERLCVCVSACAHLRDMRAHLRERGAGPSADFKGGSRGADVGVSRGADVGLSRGADVGLSRGADVGVSRGADVGVKGVLGLR